MDGFTGHRRWVIRTALKMGFAAMIPANDNRRQIWHASICK
jgi:hypothetical protein